MNDTNTEAYIDTLNADIAADNGDYSEYLSVITDYQSQSLEYIAQQNNLLVEQNTKLAELTDVCWWIFFLILFYIVYKILLGTVLSWFNGC